MLDAMPSPAEMVATSSERVHLRFEGRATRGALESIADQAVGGGGCRDVRDRDRIARGTSGQQPATLTSQCSSCGRYAVSCAPASRAGRIGPHCRLCMLRHGTCKKWTQDGSPHRTDRRARRHMSQVANPSVRTSRDRVRSDDEPPRVGPAAGAARQPLSPSLPAALDGFADASLPPAGPVCPATLTVPKTRGVSRLQPMLESADRIFLRCMGLALHSEINAASTSL